MRNEYDVFNDAAIDFSIYQEVELTEQERADMKRELKNKKAKKISWKKCAVIAASFATVAAMSQTVFAQELIDKIIRSISTGYNTVIQYELKNPEPAPVPQELAGQIYDENGTVLTELDGKQKLYDNQGVEVVIDSEITDQGERLFLVPADRINQIPQSDETQVVFTSLEEAAAVLDFTPKTPQVLPDGYQFLYAQTYRTEKNSQEISGKYLMLAYSNGKNTFFIDERLAGEDTKFVMGSSSKVEEIQIHGNKAAVTSDSVTWEADGVSISILGRDVVTGQDLIQLAESVQ